MEHGKSRPGHGPKCGGTNRAGQPCGNTAGKGTDHVGIGNCKNHGGSTPTQRRSAQIETARRAVTTYGLPREVTPDVALLEEVHRTAGHVAWLAEIVAAIEQEDLVWGKTEEVDKNATEFGGVDTTYKAIPNIWLTLYQQERKHLAAVAKAALDAGIAERQVKLAEQQGQLLAKAIRCVLDALDLSHEQKARIPEVVPPILRAITAA